MTNANTFTYVAPVVTVTAIMNPMNGLVIAGERFSITCMFTGVDRLQARFNFILIAEGDGTTVYHASNKQFTHSFFTSASDAGMYTCKVTVTSTFLDNLITSSSTVTLTVQSKPNL